MHDDRERSLFDQLNKFDKDEADRRKNRKPTKMEQRIEGHTDFEHFADGNQDFAFLGQEQVIALCNELFHNPPVVFTIKKGEYNEIQKAIALKIQQLKITIPISHIKNDLYLVGFHRVAIAMKNGNLTMRIGGGYFTFEDYIPKNQFDLQILILQNMMKS